MLLTKTDALIVQDLRNSIKTYSKRTREIENYLEIHPGEWGRFQSEFNFEVNKVFQRVMDFERECIKRNEPHKVEKLKRIFVRNFKGYFLKGVYNSWSLRKPYGYSGDFKIIEEIYQNEPPTAGFERLFDNYFQMSAISVAVRNRKEDFKKIILKFVNQRTGNFRIMDLACGPCREVKEILTSWQLRNKKITFDCYDHDSKALDYSKEVLKGYQNVNFIQMNALKIGTTKKIHDLINQKYDVIYATGLFDYLNFKISLGLVKNLRYLLNDGGILAISDVRDKFSNPSVYYMEWVGEWQLLYTHDDEFRKIFRHSGFNDDQLKFTYEQQGILQYGIATNINQKNYF